MTNAQGRPVAGRPNHPSSSLAESTERVEVLWCNWGRDDGEFEDQIRSYRVSRITATRVYFRDRLYPYPEMFLDRRTLETEGRAFHRPTGDYFYTERPLSDAERRAGHKSETVSRLRKAAADAHPDRGGTAEAFQVAYSRYQRAVGRG